MAILFTQIATVAYACPVLKGVDADRSGATAGMPCPHATSPAAMLDADQPGLCLQHCQFGTTQLPADQAQPVCAAVAAPQPLFVLSPVEAPAIEASHWARREADRERAPPPAHSILHCCFRI